MNSTVSSSFAVAIEELSEKSLKSAFPGAPIRTPVMNSSKFSRNGALSIFGMNDAITVTVSTKAAVDRSDPQPVSVNAAVLPEFPVIMKKNRVIMIIGNMTGMSVNVFANRQNGHRHTRKTKTPLYRIRVK